MEIENQEKTWNEIAFSWKDFKNVKPVQESIDFLKNKEGNVLDLGCGSGRNFTKIKGKIYGIDFSEKMIKHAEDYASEKEIDIELIKANAWNLPFKDDFFDAVICVAVIHCIPSLEKREKSLKELLRVLKPGAEAWISVWDKNQDKFKDAEKETIIPWKYDGKEYNRYYYLYETNEFVSLLKKVGFDIIQINNSENPNGFNSRRNIEVIVRKPD